MKQSLLASMFITALLLSRAAAAQDAAAAPRLFGGKGGIVISAERLFGFDHSSTTTTTNGVDSTANATNISFFGNPLTGLTSPYGMPRIALDGFIANGFSIGGSLAYFSSSLSTEGSTTSTDLSGFLVAPRAGFAAMLGAAAAVWPRLGVSYVSLDGGNTTSSQLALTAEAPFAFIVGQHLLLMIGPTFDLGLTGTRETSLLGMSTSRDWKGIEFGVQGALGGTF